MVIIIYIYTQIHILFNILLNNLIRICRCIKYIIHYKSLHISNSSYSSISFYSSTSSYSSTLLPTPHPYLVLLLLLNPLLLLLVLLLLLNPLLNLSLNSSSSSSTYSSSSSSSSSTYISSSSSSTPSPLLPSESINIYSRGAEASLYLSTFAGRECIIKERLPKV